MRLVVLSLALISIAATLERTVTIEEGENRDAILLDDFGFEKGV